MKRILVFGITENPGGIESVIMNYYRHIDRKKVQFDFLCNTKDVAYEEEIIELGGNIYRICARSKNYKKYKQDMKDFFNKNSKKYDAIWINVCSLANIDYLKYAKKYGIKKRIIHCHNSQNMDSFLRGCLHKFNRLFISKYATDFWSCSKEASKWFYSKKIINGDRYLLVNNAIDCEKFKYNEKIRKDIRNKLGLKDEIVFGNVGRLHFQKNQKFAIEVFNEFCKKHPNSILLLIGDGEDKEELREMCKSLKIEDKVRFLGLRKDVPELLQGMDVFIFPSLFEGLSLSLLEAQASGLLIFTSKNVSIETKMSDYIFFLELDNVDLWVKNIENEIINNKNRKNRKNDIKNGFDISIEAKKIEERL